jgi:single-stranded-DNA-specific exonuclease
VLAQEDWHPGVIGIVASRLVERYHRPFVMVALGGEGEGRGSGRSIAPYDLHAGLSASADHLEGFGGHRMAAGLQLRAARLEGFRDALVAHARGCLSPEDLIKVERVDAVVPGDVLGLDLAEELQQLRPFGIGNPGVSVLVPAAKVSDVRAMGGGRHVRFTVTSGGTRSRAVGFGIGPGQNGLRDADARHDLSARLEANEWQGAVEPRLVVRSLHPVEAPAACDGAGGCSACSCRMDDEAWWDAAWSAYEQPEFAPLRTAHGERRTVCDHRHQGALGKLGDLITTGESLLVVCADVSRRAAPLERDLDAGRFARSPWAKLSGRCDGATVARVTAGATLALCDYAALECTPALPTRFAHVFLLDPPCSDAMLSLLTASAPSAGEFLHLGWGPAEVEFARRVVEHDHALRPHLVALFRTLSSLPQPAPEADRALFEGEGRHPRPPSLVGRCLRVLTELNLGKFERSSATVRCTITTGKRVDLERSPTFRACAAAGEERLRYLETLTLRARSERAA